MGFCANCGAKMSDDSEFCAECGWKKGTEVKFVQDEKQCEEQKINYNLNNDDYKDEVKSNFTTEKRRFDLSRLLFAILVLFILGGSLLSVLYFLVAV